MDTNLRNVAGAELRPSHDRAAIRTHYQHRSLTSVVALHELPPTVRAKRGGALTKSLAVEWATRCVRQRDSPGVFRTALNEGLLDGTERGRELLLRTPMRRFGQPDELAGAAVFLASEAASFVTGHLLAVDGGFLASGVNQ